MERGKKSQHGCVRWALCEHLTSPCHDLACGGLREGGGSSNFLANSGNSEQPKTSKNHYRPIFSPFQAIFNNFDSFHFWQFFLGTLFLTGGLKSQKIVFNQFSRHFRQFWTTLFFPFWQNFFRYPIFLGGGGLKTNFLAISGIFEQLWFFFIFDKNIF